MNSVLQSVGSGVKDPIFEPDEPCSLPRNIDSKQEDKDCVEALAAQRSSLSHRVLTSRSWPSLGVATAFELSENFFPEAYTMDSQIPRSCVIVVSSYEYSRTRESITNVYKILYLAAYRRWQWLSLSVEIPCSSMYRAAIRTTQRSGCRQWQTPTMGSAGLLPYSVIKMFQGFLCENQHIVDQSKLCVSLSDCDTISLLPSITPISSSTLPDLESTDALCRLHDLGCCRFDENDVVQLEIVDPPMIFCSSLVGNGQLVYEIKSITTRTSPGDALQHPCPPLHERKGWLYQTCWHRHRSESEASQELPHRCSTSAMELSPGCG